MTRPESEEPLNLANETCYYDETGKLVDRSRPESEELEVARTYGRVQYDLRRKAEADRDRALAALGWYGDHQSWRCEHPDRYPWEPDCPCGLTKVQRELGIEVG